MFAVSTMLDIDRKWKSNVQEHAPNCPRCASANTKFCYYNNYSLSQPRYFCKGCRRYWTKGGSLRNVPVGGGCRKSRRGKSSSRVVDKSGDQLSMFNYKKNLNGFGSNVMTSSSDGDSAGTHVSGSDIDLAAVFAKFLDQGTSFDDQIVTQHSPNEGIDHVCSSSLEQDNNCSQNDSGMEFPAIPGSNYMLQELPQVKQQMIEENSSVHPELLETDDHMNAFGLQNLLDGEMVQMDALWPSDDDATTPTPIFEWQPMAQLQQFQSFPADDDQLKVSANLMAENWSSSFDFPAGFGLFSEP